MEEELSLVDAYRIAALELQEALIHNNAPRALTLVLQQSELLQKLRVRCEADPGVRAEVSRLLSGLSGQTRQNELLLSQVSEVFNNCVREIARVHIHNDGYQRQQV